VGGKITDDAMILNEVAHRSSSFEEDDRLARY
jgi:hypothetical protein